MAMVAIRKVRLLMCEILPESIHVLNTIFILQFSGLIIYAMMSWRSPRLQELFTVTTMITLTHYLWYPTSPLHLAAPGSRCTDSCQVTASGWCNNRWRNCWSSLRVRGSTVMKRPWPLCVCSSDSRCWRVCSRPRRESGRPPPARGASPRSSTVCLRRRWCCHWPR